ncbi:MAG: DUF423 domain-containing protein [Leptospiraceae bacterium]|nr:DUF423 domain-containing protein [Leptospiraceae bacterium]
MVSAAGAIFLMIAVILGALGSHAIKPHISAEMLIRYDLALQYHFIHALAMLVIGQSKILLDKRLGRAGVGVLTGGWLIFCGGLYLYSMTSIRIFSKITPVGGLMMIVGWLLIAIQYLLIARRNRNET